MVKQNHVKCNDPTKDHNEYSLLHALYRLLFLHYLGVDTVGSENVICKEISLLLSCKTKLPCIQN